MIKVKLPSLKPTSYPIHIGYETAYQPQAWLAQHISSSSKVVIITDKRVEQLYLTQIKHAIQSYCEDVIVLAIPEGESAKNHIIKHQLDLQLLEHKCDRQTLCIAVGGGVVGDITGFVAATYMRGIRYIQIPSTLLAMVDSSVGGKTAINSSLAKNSIGVIYQPVAVVIDLSFLTSLAKTQLVNGLVEAIKMFLTYDAKAFYYVSNNLDLILNRQISKLKWVIEKSLRIKAKIVYLDEKEQHIRQTLNLGHTVGHALEKVLNYEVLHGYAVALGIIVEARCAVNLDILTQADYQAIVEMFLAVGIDSSMLVKLNIEEVIDAMLLDKKNKNKNIYCVLLNKIGSVYTVDNNYSQIIPLSVLRASFNQVLDKS